MERDRNTWDGLQDCGTGLLEELLGFFESEATILDSQLMSSSFSMQSSTFQSAIKFHGRPILPPVMTDERFEEMAMYKRQAIFTETRLKARGRQKLLSRVQSIVDSMNRPSSLKSSQGRTSPESNSSKMVRPESPPNISSEPATDITRPISQETMSSIAPDSLELEAEEPKVSPVMPTAKASPRSEAKDSGFSSQSQVKASPVEVSAVTTDPHSEEPQDTMAEIDDISDDDLDEAAAIAAEPIKISMNQVPARPRTVAERLGSAFELLKKGDEQASKPPTVSQTSARSSVSGTTSTASTDTTLQDTVLVQGTIHTTETQLLDNHVTENRVDESLEKTDETMESAGIENGFEPLSSTRSLLSRVAFNFDDDESPEHDVQPMKIGDISKISCSLQSQDTNAVIESVEDVSSVVSHAEAKPDPDQPSLVTEQSSNLSVGPIVTPDVSQIEASLDNSVAPEDVPGRVDKSTLPEVQMIPVSETTQGSSLNSESEQPVSHSAFAPSTQNQSDVSSGTPGSAQDVAESTNLTMYTTSTDIDKYMQGSQDTDTIRSSMTTLPHILDDSISVSEIGELIVSVPVTQATSMSQENLPDVRLSATAPTKSVSSGSTSVETLNMSGYTEPPKPTASVSSPEKIEPQAKDRILRKGSYTVDSPSSGILRRASYTLDSPSPAIHRRGSYTLESPSPALLLATQQTDNGNKETERPKSVLGITQPTCQNTVKDHMNHSQAQSEPTRITQYALTSSMEDLKLRPVQRTLNFDYDSESNHTQTQSERNGQNIDSRNIAQVPPQPVRVGKEEHLQRYLQTLSQMPQVNPNQTSVSESVQSSPKEKTSETSSPGQVDPHHMNGLGSLGALSGVEMSTGGLSEEALSQSMQMEFENLQSQLMEQQQQQLSQLLQEQQRQQMVMQQEFLRYESMLLESSATDQDALLYQQLQDRQRELLQQQMAMQQQLRWQMQQQRQQLQAQLLYLKQSQGLQVKTDSRAKPVMGKKTKRKKWQEPQRTDEWVIEAQSETASVTSDSNIAVSSTLSGTGAAQADRPANQRYFSDILPGDQTQNSTDTTSSAYFMPASRNRNRSGVSMGSDPFATQRSESGMSTNTDIHGFKKRVSFSTDIDAGSDAGSLTSRSTSRSGAVSEPLPAGHYRVGSQYFPVPSIEPLLETAESLETSILSSVTNSPTRLAKAGYTQSPVSSITSSRISKTSRGSPRSPRHVALSGPKISIYDPVPPELQKKFDRVSAAAKGYLTRRLMRSDKVNQIIKTITDTAEFAINFQSESPIKQGQCTNQDKELVERVLAQLTAALYEIHEIFFEIPVAEKMSLIAQTRASERERIFKQRQAKKKSNRLSSATMKALERKKKAQAAEMAVFGDLRPKSCPPATSSPVADKRPDLTGPLRRNYQYMMSRVLKPIQAHLSPIKPVKDTINRAVAMEKREQREKAASKQKPVTINIKNVKPRIDSHLGPKKPSPSNNNNTVTIPAPNRPPPSTRPKSAQSTHPWK